MRARRQHDARVVEALEAAGDAVDWHHIARADARALALDEQRAASPAEGDRRAIVVDARVAPLADDHHVLHEEALRRLQVGEREGVRGCV